MRHRRCCRSAWDEPLAVASCHQGFAGTPGERYPPAGCCCLLTWQHEAHKKGAIQLLVEKGSSAVAWPCSRIVGSLDATLGARDAPQRHRRSTYEQLHVVNRRGHMSSSMSLRAEKPGAGGRLIQGPTETQNTKPERMPLRVPHRQAAAGGQLAQERGAHKGRCTHRDRRRGRQPHARAVAGVQRIEQRLPPARARLTSGRA